MTAKKKAELVGDELREARIKRGLNLGTVEVATKIRGKYLNKLEANDYDMPNDVYIRGFVQSYGDYLGLDGRELAKQYDLERGGLEAPERSAPKPVKTPKLVLTPKLAIAAATLALAGIVVAYLAWQFSALAAAPRLELTSPTSDQRIVGSVVEVSGTATPGADVLINDSPILVDAEGKFSDKLALTRGLNTIRITARNKLGKSTTISRNILAEIPEVAASDVPLVPKAVFDGIAVGVSIKDAATWIIVEVDGKEAFRGTMLAGTSQSFKGAERVKVTTGNAGKTALIITNKVVVEKTLDPLGNDGEIKRDLDFAKDTVVQ